MPRQSKMSVPIVKGAAKKLEALDLRVKGYSYKEIAEEMKVAKQTAYNHVKSALMEQKEKYRELAELVREQELLRLDIMLKALVDKIENGDTTAINTALKIMERRAFYIPTEIEKVNTSTSAIPEIVSKNLEELSVDQLMERYGSQG